MTAGCFLAGKRSSTGSGAYSSIKIWAFTPPAPNEETPAILGNSMSLPLTLMIGLFHSSSSCCTLNGELRKSIFGFSTFECREGASCLYFIWSNTFVTPAIPAALSQCPIFDLADPIAQNCLSSVSCVNTLDSPVISIGSPREVPVPWASM